MKVEYFPRLMAMDDFPVLKWRLCRVTLKLAVLPCCSLLWSEKLLHTGGNIWSVFFNLLLILLVVQKLECLGQAHTETVWWFMCLTWIESDMKICTRFELCLVSCTYVSS
jgi:hypothetical protein